MQKEDLLNLVLNSIRDSKVIVENYDYFKQQDNTGLWSDYNQSVFYLETIQSYYKTYSKKELKNIHQTLTNYYKPYIEVFSQSNDSIIRSKKLGKSFGLATMIGLIITIFDNNFFYATLPPLVITLSCFGYSKHLSSLRKQFLSCFNKLYNETQNIKPKDLAEILNQNRNNIESLLISNFSYKKV